jgi:hypothetical protein
MNTMLLRMYSIAALPVARTLVAWLGILVEIQLCSKLSHKVSSSSSPAFVLLLSKYLDDLFTNKILGIPCELSSYMFLVI